MTKDEFAALLDEIQLAERTMRIEGQKEYAHRDDNCFANFDADAEIGISRLQSMMAHAGKHWRGIQAYVNGHTSQREDIRGRLKDLRMYLALIWGAIDEDESKRLHEALLLDAEQGTDDGLDTTSIIPANPLSTPAVEQQLDVEQLKAVVRSHAVVRRRR